MMTKANLNDMFPDEALKKSARGDRSQADASRELKDGTALDMDERRRMLRAEEEQMSILPDPNNPPTPGWHYCWLSSTNQNDPIYKRLRKGYELVKAEEMPYFGVQNKVTSGEFAGCISINEMILAKIPQELYQELMLINHHEKPLREEEFLKANAAPQGEDSHGTNLGQREGFDSLARRVRTPTFA